jgi:hypothetical protein
MLSSLLSTGRPLLHVFFGAVLFCCLTPPASAQQPPQRIPAPELEGGTGWIGIDKPLQLKDLRGKIVVFDFWTLC